MDSENSISRAVASQDAFTLALPAAVVGQSSADLPSGLYRRRYLRLARTIRIPSRPPWSAAKRPTLYLNTIWGVVDNRSKRTGMLLATWTATKSGTVVAAGLSVPIADAVTDGPCGGV